MSDSERPDLVALEELEQLVRVLGDEMATWRKRAHEAESRLRSLGDRGDDAGRAARSPREGALEKENAELRQRLEAARQRARQLLDRMRFLRQQHEMEARP